MARGRPTISKRQREIARQEKKKEKAERRALRMEDKPDRDTTSGGDPDIADIVPGPQPPIWETENI